MTHKGVNLAKNTKGFHWGRICGQSLNPKTQKQNVLLKNSFQARKTLWFFKVDCLKKMGAFRIDYDVLLFFEILFDHCVIGYHYKNLNL